MTYADVVALSESKGFCGTKRRLVFCLSTNEPGALSGYLALLKSGAVPLLVSSSLPTKQLTRLIAIYQPSFLWMPQVRRNEVPTGLKLDQYLGYELVVMPMATSYPVHDDLALLLSTSGSTGSPKFVRLSHENILSNAESIAQFLEIGPDDRPITTLPPHYTYGLSIIHSHLLKGCAIALTNRTLLDRGFWSFFESVQASSFGGVPYHYELLKKLRFQRMPLTSLHTFTQAGGKMGAELSREFAMHCESRGVRFVTMYGQVEATARISYLRPQHALGKAGSIGQAVPGGELFLVDEHGVRITHEGTVGQLVYRGPNVFLGYANSYSDLGRGDEIGGTIKTGDLAYFDADGDYFIAGRIKRFIKLFGHSVHLQDIEDELSSMGYQVACTGADDQLDIYFCVAATDNLNAIKSRLVSQYNIPPTSIRIYLISELPRNESGKIQYAELAALQRSEYK